MGVGDDVQTSYEPQRNLIGSGSVAGLGMGDEVDLERNLIRPHRTSSLSENCSRAKVWNMRFKPPPNLNETSSARKVKQGIGMGDDVDLKRNLLRTSSDLQPFRKL